MKSCVYFFIMENLNQVLNAVKNKIRQTILLAICFLFFRNTVFAQTTLKTIATKTISSLLLSANTERSFSTSKTEALNSKIVLNLPMPGNKNMTFSPIESPVMDKNLSKKFPNIKTYRLFGLQADSKEYGVLTLSEAGIQALIFTDSGMVNISTYNISLDQYRVEYQTNELNVPCEISESLHRKRLSKARIKGVLDFNTGSILRTYKLAIATTAEFFTNNGSTQTSAQAAVLSIVNGLRAVYEKEASISFSLVATKIYEDPLTDPFNPSSSTKAKDAALGIGALSISEPASFALNLYDVGHVLHHSPGGGGVAYLEVPCWDANVSSSGVSPFKAGGWSGVTTTAINTFIHEMGHQFGSGHTLNSISGSCTGNLTSSWAFEPGNGNTYMGYFSCFPDNLSSSSRTYFHAGSLESFNNYIATDGGCKVDSPTGNTPPVANVNPSSKIMIVPKGTPFRLEGSATDANSDPLTFNWEQYDLGSTRGGADEAQNSADSPIFRSYVPSSTGNNRDLPSLNAILGGSVPCNDEALPQVARTLNFRLNTRDNKNLGGGTDSKNLSLTVDSSGPFLISSQNTPSYWTTGSSRKQIKPYLQVR
jgi:hypothetical protein